MFLLLLLLHPCGKFQFGSMSRRDVSSATARSALVWNWNDFLSRGRFDFCGNCCCCCCYCCCFCWGNIQSRIQLKIDAPEGESVANDPSYNGLIDLNIGWMADYAVQVEPSVDWSNEHRRIVSIHRMECSECCCTRYCRRNEKWGLVKGHCLALRLSPLLFFLGGGRGWLLLLLMLLLLLLLLLLKHLYRFTMAGNGVLLFFWRRKERR